MPFHNPKRCELILCVNSQNLRLVMFIFLCRIISVIFLHFVLFVPFHCPPSFKMCTQRWLLIFLWLLLSFPFVCGASNKGQHALVNSGEYAQYHSINAPYWKYIIWIHQYYWYPCVPYVIIDANALSSIYPMHRSNRGSTLQHLQGKPIIYTLFSY